jgi:negative regulator of sigma E activity
MNAAQLELITAAVDGELSAAERRALRTLMASSAEARALYARLKADSERVRTLPRAAAPADLHAKVMARLAASTPVPTRKTAPAPAQPATPAQPAQPALPPRRRIPAWVPVAVAASVLLCVTAGSFAFFSQGGANATAKQKPTQPANGGGEGEWAKWLPADHDRTPSAPPQEARPDPSAVVRVDVLPVPPHPRIVEPDAISVAPEPRPVTGPLHASPLRPALPPFDLVQVRVPFLRTVAELDREDIRQELIDELGRDPAFRLDLFVRDPARGVEVFQNAAKATGLTVFADAATVERLKKRQVAAVVIYTESLTPAELAALFAKVRDEDAKFSPRVCDSLHATPVAREDEIELKRVLGMDAGLFKRPGGTGSNGAGQGTSGDPKPVSAGTIDMIVKNVSGQPAKSGDHRAVLLTWQTTHPSIPRTNPTTSAELKQFLAKRGDRKPNAVPAIIVIRPAG